MKKDTVVDAHPYTPDLGNIPHTFWECPDLNGDACRQKSCVGEKGFYRPWWCDDVFRFGNCPRGYAR